MKVFLFIWQLPQNFLGKLIVFLTRAIKRGDFYICSSPWFTGVSLGNYIIIGSVPYVNFSIDKNLINHEKGHQKQSLILGWLYLFVVGIPSFIGNIIDRYFHNEWDDKERDKWYYNQPWERWADKLGKVEREY